VAKSSSVALGNDVKTYDYWALTCTTGVQGITDYRAKREGTNWKTLEASLLIDRSDIDAYHLGLFHLGVNIADGVNGFFTSVNHQTGSPHVDVVVELAVPAGQSTDDSSYWTINWGICGAPDIGAQADYEVEQDDSCPIYFTADKNTRQVYYIVITRWPARILRGVDFILEAEIQDKDGNLASLSTTIDQTVLVLATPMGRDRFWSLGIAFTAGTWTDTLSFGGGVDRLAVPIGIKITSTLKNIKTGFPDKAGLVRNL
jgi:hypothetical protein